MSNSSQSTREEDMEAYRSPSGWVTLRTTYEIYPLRNWTPDVTDALWPTVFESVCYWWDTTPPFDWALQEVHHAARWSCARQSQPVTSFNLHHLALVYSYLSNRRDGITEQKQNNVVELQIWFLPLQSRTVRNHYIWLVSDQWGKAWALTVIELEPDV